MAHARLVSFLLGRERTLTVRYLLVATGLFIFTLGLWGLVYVINTYDLIWPIRNLGLLVGVFAAVSIGSAAVQAYQNRGLLVSWALGSAIPLGLYIVPTASSVMPPDETVLWGIWSGLMFGISLGTLGFALGVAIHRAVLIRENRRHGTNAST